MTTFEKINNVAFASMFGAIGLTALVAAVFFGATHHFSTAGICAIMSWALWGEIRREKKLKKIK